MANYFRLAVVSIPWTFAHMLFFYWIGLLANFNMGSLAFSPFGFVVFYVATFMYLRSLSPP